MISQIKFEDLENFEVPKLHGVSKILKVAKDDGNAEDSKVAKIFESWSHQDEDTNSFYCDLDSSLDNDKMPPSKKDMSLEEMDRVLNLVSILTEEMSICWYSTHISNHAITKSCRIHPFWFHSKESCLDFLLAWDIAM